LHLESCVSSCAGTGNASSGLNFIIVLVSVLKVFRYTVRLIVSDVVVCCQYKMVGFF
jgi:hypothetical protein